MFIYSSNTGVKTANKPVTTRLKKVSKEQLKPNAKKSPFVSEQIDRQPKTTIKEKSFAENATQTAKAVSDSTKKPFFNYVQMVLFAMAIGALGFMYLAHVRQTTQLFEQRNQLLLQHESTQHRVEELQRRYERIISPSEIYDKATKAGFEAPKANDLFIERK